MANKKPENLSFEEAVTELEQIVSDLESGELPLEASLKQFERGILLARSSQTKLQQAEQKVQILLQQHGQEQLQPFEQADAQDD